MASRPIPIEMTPIEQSSTIAAVGYDRAARELAVQYKSGGHYRYRGVEPPTYEDLMKAPSTGKFVAAEISRTYPYERIDPEGDA